MTSDVSLFAVMDFEHQYKENPKKSENDNYFKANNFN